MDKLIQSRRIAYSIRDKLVEELSKAGYIGDTNLDSTDLKSHHSIDKVATKVILGELRKTNAAIYIEGEAPIIPDKPACSIYIDPVDGSLNWDRGVGDPCIAIAISDNEKINCLNDLNFAYVYGLRSGDEYWAEKGCAYYFCNLTQNTHKINAAKTSGINNMVAYFRTGYGMAKKQLQKTLPLFYKVKDIRAIDNAGIEICEIARGASDLMIEARDGSDGFNLIAYPILKAAGGALFSLDGLDLGLQSIKLEHKLNYIALGNPNQIKKIIENINN